jgi:AcrR family transcriptional regulator
VTSRRTDPGLRWIKPPQQARSQETLDRILNAAEGLIADKGVDDTPISEIVRRAGSSVGAFYTRFEDKDALIHALYERYLEQAMATSDEALDPDRWQGARIDQILGSAVRFLVSIYREQHGLLTAFSVRTRTHPEFRARQERLSHYVNEQLCALLLARADEISHPDPAIAAAFGLTIVFSTIESTILFGEMRSGALSFDDAELASELTRSYLAYLGIREASPDA